MKLLGSIKPGTTVHYHDRAITVLEYTASGVFVQLNDSIGEFKFGKTNDWRENTLREYLNGEFAKQLTDGNLDDLLDTVTDLTALDGTTDYGSSTDKVALLTLDQCRKYRYTRPLPESWEWTSTPASTPGGWDEDRIYACYLITDGRVVGNYCTYTYGIRPALTLPSTLTVKVPGDTQDAMLELYTNAELLEELLKRQRKQ